MRRALSALLLLLAAAAAPPRPAAAGDLLLSAGDLAPAGLPGLAAARLVPPDPAPGLPAVDPAATDAAAVLLRRLAAAGRAAGAAGLVYDNRDRGHSDLPAATLPGLARLRYDAALRAAGLDYGLAGAILLPRAITFGNSSTAVTGGDAPRSLGRLAMTTASGPARAFAAHAGNRIDVYPAHLDHDAADLFPANWPYMVLSQGSSGSDQPFLRAIALTLAAFPPETRARLAREGLVAPALQMILRRSLVTVRSRDAYRGPAAHPTVFAAADLAPERMVAMAAAMAPGTIPPLVRLAVEQEDFAAAAGLAGRSERLFDTPAAIARIWRGPGFRRAMLVSAAATRDPNGHALRFGWVLLRGDPARVRITPLDPAGRRARIEIAWHDPFPLPGPPHAGAPRRGSRVDIGVFAWNGTHDSAPAFVSVSFPDHEIRRYGPAPDGAAEADGVRLVSIDYDAEGRGAAYDPWLHWSAPWTDRFDAAGGWRRDHADGRSERFDAEGRRLGPAGPEPLGYRIRPQGRAALLEAAAE